MKPLHIIFLRSSGSQVPPYAWLLIGLGMAGTLILIGLMTLRWVTSYLYDQPLSPLTSPWIFPVALLGFVLLTVARSWDVGWAMKTASASMKDHVSKRLLKRYILARHGIGVFGALGLGLFVFAIFRATAIAYGWDMPQWLAHLILIAYIVVALIVGVSAILIRAQAKQQDLRKTARYQQGKERSIEAGLDHTDSLTNWIMALQCQEPEAEARAVARQLHRVVDDQKRGGRGKRKM